MNEEQFKKALDDIKEWMQDNRAAPIVDNLAPGASEQELAEVENELGHRFLDPLRRLYLLHNGQRNRDEHPFFEGGGRFTDLEYGVALIDSLLDFLWQGDEQGAPEDVAEAMADSEKPLLAEECTSAWWPVAEAEGGYIAVNLRTGRVFEVEKEGPVISYRGDDVGEYLAAYADALWNDNYEVAGDTELDGVTAEGFTSFKRHIQRK